MNDVIDQKAQVLADVRAHMLIYGAKKWDMVLSKYPTIGRRTFYRWVAEIRDLPLDGKSSAKGRRVPGFAEGRRILEQQHAAALEEGANRARLVAVKNIPASPSPDYMVRAGIKAEEQMDFLAMITRLAKDGEMLREFAMKADPDAVGGQAIKNPMVFATSIDKRLKVIDTAVRIMQEVWDLQHMQKFFDAIVDIIVDEIGPAHPDIQAKILARLKDLNDQRGMTQYAGMT